MNQTASERYAEHQREIFILLQWIKDELEIHEFTQKDDPMNWGLVGTLASAKQELKQTLCRISGPGFDMRDVDEALDGLRD